MKQNGKTGPAKTGPEPSMKRGQRRQLHGRVRDREADREQRDGAELHEGREVVARREQQPHRQHARDEAVDDERQRERLLVEVEERAQRLALADAAPRPRPRAAPARHRRGSPRARGPGARASCRRPSTSAIGIVAATVAVAHGLPYMAFTTTRPSTPIRITMIASTPTSAAAPPTGPISSRTIWPSDLPSRRSERDQDRHVLHRAAEHDAGQDVERARAGSRTARRGSARPAGPGPAIAAKWWPKTTQRLVGTKSLPSFAALRGRRARGRRARRRARRAHVRVEAVADRVDAERGDQEPGARERLAAAASRSPRAPPRRAPRHPPTSPARSTLRPADIGRAG